MLAVGVEASWVEGSADWDRLSVQGTCTYVNAVLLLPAFVNKPERKRETPWKFAAKNLVQINSQVRRQIEVIYLILDHPPTSQQNCSAQQIRACTIYNADKYPPAALRVQYPSLVRRIPLRCSYNRYSRFRTRLQFCLFHTACTAVRKTPPVTIDETAS